MGLNWHGLKYLCEQRARGMELGRVATIGRLNRYVGLPQARQLFEGSGLAHAFNDSQMAEGDGYAELLFEQLGATSVDSIDASDYEGATIVADLNKAIPEALHERFDTVYDGGTIEHVFDIATAMSNLMNLVKPGGSLIIETMANNCFGHGFYQFSPELFYRVLSSDNGYQMERLIVHENYEFAQWHDVPDPIDVRSRIEMANGWAGVILFAHARREKVVELFRTPPQQSDYSVSWETVTPALAEPSEPALARRMIDLAKQRLPGVLRAKHALFAKYPSLPRAIRRRAHLRQKQKNFSMAEQPEKFRIVD